MMLIGHWLAKDSQKAAASCRTPKRRQAAALQGAAGAARATRQSERVVLVPGRTSAGWLVR
jgi:hypothetical protein